MEKPTAGVVEAQHIPPKSTWTAVLHLIKTNPEISSSLDRTNKDVFYLMMKMKHDPNGKTQLCMNALSSDHRHALSSGNSAESRACRSHLISTPGFVSSTAIIYSLSTDPCMFHFHVPQTFPDENLFKWRHRESAEALLNDGPSSMLGPHLE